MIKIIFVCLGNICRSPLAEAIFKDLVRKEGLENVVMCDSAGTSNYHIGSPPDPRTIQNAKKNQIKIEHLARQFSVDDFQAYNYILAMDTSNKKNILNLLNKETRDETKVMLMRKFEPEDADTIDVPDPYYSDGDGFQHVHDILQRTCKKFLDFIIKEHQLI